MCELDILHDSLYQFCPELHLKRLNSLTLACHALLDCKTLTLTELGRNLPTKARTKHNIKRIDRLLGNRHLHKERLAVYRWHASFICSGNTMPIVLVDWSDIREQKRLMVLRASVALHGRSVTLYEKAFPLSEQCSKKAHDQFLADLASILLPSNTTPLIVSDAGFKVPWYKSVEKLGWYWLSRVRGKVQYADLGAENWKPISNLHDMSSSHSKTLGYKRLTKSNPISCQILLYKSRSKGRKNQRSTRTHCHHPSPKIYSASAKEPWVLATNLPVEIRTPKQLVNIYSKRMQIEETFRDLKSPAYGLGLRHSRTSSSERFDIMLLIALMLQLTCWLAGVHAQKQGWDKHFQANTVRNRNVLSTVRLGMEVLRHSGYTITREDLLVAATLLAQNLFTHGYALGKLWDLSVRRILEDIKGIKVVGEACCGEDAVKWCRANPVDVVLMDMNMPGIGGLEATRKIARSIVDTKVIMLTVHTENPLPAKVMQAGAAGYLSKGAAPQEVVNAIRCVASGQRYIASDIAQQMALSQIEPEKTESPFASLSERELQIMLMITKGQKVNEISEQLNLSPKTVNSYRYRMFSKLNIHGDVELTHLAIRHGLCNAESLASQ